MALNVVLFVSVVLTAVAMAGGFAHLLALPNKMKLSRDDYLTAQPAERSARPSGAVFEPTHRGPYAASVAVVACPSRPSGVPQGGSLVSSSREPPPGPTLRQTGRPS